MQKRVSLFTQVLLGLSVFYAYFIRDIGIILIPTLLIFQIQNQQKTDSKNRFMLQLIPYFIFAFLFLFVRLILPAGNENHYGMLFSNFSPAAMTQNSSYYLKTFSELFVGEQNQLLFYFHIPIAVIGCFAAKKQTHFIFYFFFTWIIVSAWPVIQGERFLFPLIPLFLLFFVRGLQFIFSFFRNSKRYLYLTMGLLSIFFVGSAIPKVLDFSRGDHNEACSPEMKIMYTFISNHTQKTDLIGFFKPTVLRLFTGRNSILVSSEKFELSPARYLLTEISDTMKIQNSCIPLFTSGNYVLLTRKLPSKLGI